MALLQTMLDAHDKYHISNSKGDFERTILISNKLKYRNNRLQISTTDSDITPEECEELYSNGFFSAKNFLETWNFDEWVEKHR
jgi:NTE family protein